MLKDIVIPDFLKVQKNLLGFSGGVDSSALFYQLLEAGIDFDIAIVNYGLRDQSKEEEAYARNLALRHNIQIYVLNTTEDLSSNTEAIARNIRYDFFEGIIKEHGYNNLILAHQLNDKVEWLLMKMATGAGINSMVGFDVINNDREYTIVRPMIFIPRDTIEDYLNTKNITYFIDESNLTDKYTRNQYRNHFVSNFVKQNSSGISNSFKILLEEKHQLYPDFNVIKINNDAFCFLVNDEDSIEKIVFMIDSVVKRKFNYVLSSSQRKELEKQNFSVIFTKFSVTLSHINKKKIITIFNNSDEKNIVIPKKQRETYRIQGFCRILRPFLYKNNIKVEDFPV